MNDTEIQPILTSIISEAGELVKEGFYTTKQISFKGPSDPVTNIDLASETLIRERLKQYFPDIEVLGEEYGGNIISDELRWVIDPIDGTRNFAAGIPHFCVSIGLVQGNNPIVGAIYDPIRDELFFAQSNQGATLNGEVMQVSTKTNPEDFIIGLDIGHVDNKAIHAFKLIENLFPSLKGYKRTYLLESNMLNDSLPLESEGIKSQYDVITELTFDNEQALNEFFERGANEEVVQAIREDEANFLDGEQTIMYRVD